MAKVTFTENLQRHVLCPPVEARGQTVREVLEAALAGNERALGYVLDDQKALRKHMAIFVNGRQVRDRVQSFRRGRRRRPDLRNAGAVGRLSAESKSDTKEKRKDARRAFWSQPAKAYSRSRRAVFNAPWNIERVDFLADNVSVALVDPRDGYLYAALDHGHFGVKMHRSAGFGAAWEEVRCPRLSAEARGRGKRRSDGPADPVEHGHGSGRSKPAAPMSRACSGAARCPVVFSSRRITARPGRSSTRSGAIRNARRGPAVAPIFQAFIRSSSIRGIPSTCLSAFRPAACG